MNFKQIQIEDEYDIIASNSFYEVIDLQQHSYTNLTTFLSKQEKILDLEGIQYNQDDLNQVYQNLRDAYCSNNNLNNQELQGKMGNKAFIIEQAYKIILRIKGWKVNLS